MKNSKIKKIAFIFFNFLSVVVGLLMIILAMDYYSQEAQCMSYNTISTGCQTAYALGALILGFSVFINVLNLHRILPSKVNYDNP